ncbi:hypothetical protein [Mycobacterium marinum]|uniref:hypothetical protein n=1 Tax=Mycobacterium marinum TaxID=1781 RepID=UPI003562E159
MVNLSGEGLIQKASGWQPWGLRQHFGVVVIDQAEIVEQIPVFLDDVRMAVH